LFGFKRKIRPDRRMYAITKTGIAANLSITRAAMQKIRKMNFT
jgi:hypothetical protein